MRYIVLADRGAYTAGQVLDLGDAEAAATLIRTTGVSLLRLQDAPRVPLPEPELRRATAPRRAKKRAQP